MCGIFGVVGTKDNASKLVFAGLKDIEYRGYDSWGISFFTDNRFKTLKKIGFLPKSLNLVSSTLSIGHTRWATHGGVTDENAHPHMDCTNKLTLVHNGIFENYLELKNTLKNHKFKSQTDTEVIIHLIEEQLKSQPLAEAVATVFNKLQGLNAVVVSDGKDIVACKIGSPLVVGRTKNGFIIASDPNAILQHTSELIFLEDGQQVILNSSLELFDLKTSAEIKPQFTKVKWEYAGENLKDFPHFMLKEIYEQPQVLYNQIQNLENIENIAQEIKKAFGTYFIGCGSAGYACILGEYLFSQITKKHVNFALGSEFNYTEHFLTDKSLLIAISQSGETIDIVEPVSSAMKKGVKVVALTNTLGSTLYRMSDIKMMLQAGPEKAVASTKALLAMIANILLLSFAVAGKLKEGVDVIEKSVKEIESILQKKDLIQKLAIKIHKVRHIYVLGRGLSYPVALESALKIKEVSYIHAEGLAGGELKHGPIALIEKGTPVIVYVPDDETKGAILANAMEVKARGAYIIGVAAENNQLYDYFFQVSDCRASSVLPNIVFAQFLGYFLATKLGYNPDKPRNLAKSVTVK
ncbi:glutamine--fructose-6-phosphate transaminase (isomerizing) [Candidatus Daviesbacteria bacterium RIFCSPHIGHO2_02_FULL_39_12]|uniref:Glutamine--fructose-6-phosphate aminotransferase [isomerizing] n=1 Tax=Candidatus Daviesbacteria bacterium RIFCSPHIGHO2_02_FULL_39_12 TaxID=1797770 RepID=A0A1F5J9G0_9BACT|nr:MAG: glutamine--fructose-6-phosphate transaminase (isomerizing) [Candidatus Daviesbacteria bacterium RIFCSPHIGHO2_02_FULL_39_12]